MRVELCSVISALAGVILGAMASPAHADWPNFRGPNHDGISDERGLKTAWTETLPAVWEREIGSAFSSFAAVGDRIYTCGTADKQQVLYCLNAETGDVIWQKGFDGEYQDSSGGNGARATPTVDDGRVYILGALGRLLCADAKDGREIWSKQFGYKPQWGYAGSVLIHGNLAITAGGGDDGAIAAFDKKTGEPIWKCATDAVGYATPYPFSFNGRDYVVGFMATTVIIADLKDGREVYRMPWQTDWNVNAASPLFHDGHLFLSSGYKTGCALLRLGADGDGLTAETVWKSKILANKFQSCVLHEGNLYASDQKAFKCVDFLTGKEQWRVNRLKHGTVILADGHLFLLTESGQLQVGKVSPESFTASAKADILTGRCWTIPVLHKGRLYARNFERVRCFDLRP